MWNHEHALEGICFILVAFCMMWAGDSLEAALIVTGWITVLILVIKVITEAYKRFIPKKKTDTNESS